MELTIQLYEALVCKEIILKISWTAKTTTDIYPVSKGIFIFTAVYLLRG